MNVIEKMKDYANQFGAAVRHKDYVRGKWLYDTVRTVAVFLELDETHMDEIMGEFEENLVQKCYLEVAIKQKNDPMYNPELLAKK